MKRILALLAVAAAGCSSPPQAPPDEMVFETALATQLAYDVGSVKAGDSVLYTVRVRGVAQPDYYKWSVVGEEGSAVWIENRRPASPNPLPMVVKSKLERTGKLLEQWIGEPGGVPAQVYPNPRRSEPPAAPRRDSTVAGVVAEEQADSLTITGKTYACTRVTTTLTYPDGRRSTMVNWLSPEVPFPVLVAGKSRGGLVRRQIGRLTVELLTFGRDAKPELTVPPK
jgi:hypothetical protein